MKNSYHFKQELSANSIDPQKEDEDNIILTFVPPEKEAQDIPYGITAVNIDVDADKTEEDEPEELDEMESDVRLFQSELKDIERYTPSIITNITKPQPFVPYLVSVLNNVPRREGPGENYKRNGAVIKNDVFKILEEATDENGFLWGKIKLGWIPLSQCRKL